MPFFVLFGLILLASRWTNDSISNKPPENVRFFLDFSHLNARHPPFAVFYYIADSANAVHAEDSSALR